MTAGQAMAQLRHAYKQAMMGTIGDQRAYATRLLGPAIETLERVCRKADLLEEWLRLRAEDDDD